MGMQINIKNIKINSISTLGSLNVGKVMFVDNSASTMKFPKPNYEENKEKEEELKKLIPEVIEPISGIPNED